jgi:outer membrane protein OmpA-like peptidoglycan-associated protein
LNAFVRSRDLAALAILCLAVGCTTNPYTGEKQISKTAAGAGIGAATGAAIGALASKNHGTGALIGAGAGALAGGGVGAYMDIQESKLRQRLAGTGVGVKRVGDTLVLVMPGNVTFGTNQSDIQASFFPVLNSVALVVKEYDKTRIEVSGFTDSTGTVELNQSLSQKRANSVAQYLIAQGVDARRIVAQGFGQSNPIASNATAEGRQENRRVELRLVPITG